jgi:hypothetical protein
MNLGGVSMMLTAFAALKLVCALGDGLEALVADHSLRSRARSGSRSVTRG